MAASGGPIGNVPGSSQAAGDKTPQHVLITDSSGNLIESFGGSGGTAVADGATFTANTTQGTPAMGAYESTPTTVTDGDVAVVGITANRELKVSVTSGGTSGTQYTEGDTDATITGNALMLEGAANALVVGKVNGGVEAGALLVTVASDSTGVLSVDDNGTTLSVDDGGSTVSVDDGGGALTVDNGGTFAVQAAQSGGWDIGTVTTVTTVSTVSAVSAVTPGTGATNLGKAEDAAHTSGDVGVMALAVRSDAGGAIAGTDGDYTPLQVNSAGELRITGGGGGTQYTEGDTDATITGTAMLMEGATNALVPAQGTVADGLLVNLGSNNDVSLNAGTNNIGDVDVLSVPAPLSTTGGGTEATALRVTVASDSTGVLSVDDNGGALTVDNAGTFAVQVDGSALTALQLIDNPVIVDDAAFTPATSSVMMAGFEADDTSTDSVDEGDAGAARMTLDRKLIVQPQPHTTGGLTIFRSIDLDESEEEVKATAGQVYAVWFSNMATSTRFLKFYNATAANVTVGTTTPVITLALPGNTSDDISGVFSTTMGIAFDTAITVAATTGIADNDTGAPAANDVICNVFFK